MKFVYWCIWKASRLFKKLKRYLRSRYWAAVFAECGRPYPHIGEGVHFTYPQHIKVGSHVSINDDVYFAAKGWITLEDNVILSNNVRIVSSNLTIDEAGNFSRKHVHTPVVLKRGCWVGTNAIILAGVTIGENSIVGAGAVVTKDIPANSICVGIPAKVVRQLAPKE